MASIMETYKLGMLMENNALMKISILDSVSYSRDDVRECQHKF